MDSRCPKCGLDVSQCTCPMPATFTSDGRCERCGFLRADGCSCPAARGAIRLFVATLAKFLSADALKDVAEPHAPRRPATKDAAATALLRGLRSTRDPFELARHLLLCLDRVGADHLRQWVEEQHRHAKKRDESLSQLLERYAGVTLEQVRAAEGSTAGYQYDPGSALELPYDHQREAIRILAQRARRRGRQKLLVYVATGGGKTRIANDWLRDDVIPTGARVLWITMRWHLLEQAAKDLCRRAKGAHALLGRVGGAVDDLLLPENPSAQIVYTTLQTFAARYSEFQKQDFDFVVIDEVHWGEAGLMQEDLAHLYGRSATFVGLTATPQQWTEYEIVCSYPFPEMVRAAVLATPRTHTVPTGIDWSPDLRAKDFTAESLGKLARSEKRNRLIVDTYRELAGKLGKTLVFACDIPHAERLTRLFRAAGIEAEVLHSDLDGAERRAILARFSVQPGENRSRTDVLVNVAIMTHGVDIRDIKTVLLARPTASDILFAQMVGRGSRRIAGEKDSFHVVDFVDNLQQHGADLMQAKAVFGSLFPPEPVSRSGSCVGVPRRRFEYEPADILVYPGKPGFEALRGLELQPRQDFGIEVELTCDGFSSLSPTRWQKLADELLFALRGAVGNPWVAPAAIPYKAPGKQHHHWNVENDPSCGWEVSSRTLRGEEGFEEAFRVVQAIDTAARRIGLRTHERTGLHVHLGWAPREITETRRLMAIAAIAEPGLFSVVGPSRYCNNFCKPVTSIWPQLAPLTCPAEWADYFSPQGSRYLSLNPKHLFDRGDEHVEVRLHDGSTDAERVLAWVSLWMRLVHAATRGHLVDERQISMDNLPLSATPAGDLAAFLGSVGAGGELLAKVRRQRDDAMSAWLQHPRYGRIAASAQASWARAPDGP